MVSISPRWHRQMRRVKFHTLFEIRANAEVISLTTLVTACFHFISKTFLITSCWLFVCFAEILIANMYGSDCALSHPGKANAWIRVPIQNLPECRAVKSNRNLYRMAGIRPLALKRIKAEMSCLTCDFGSKVLECTKCDGNGGFYFQCKSCKGSGLYGYSKCLKCKGRGRGHYKCSVKKCNDGWIKDRRGKEYRCRKCKGTGKKSNCPSCNGTGDENWNTSKKCGQCYGHGSFDEKCIPCTGTGKEYCSKCDGACVVPF